MTCLAGITKVYGTARKADSVWPASDATEVQNPCFGKVTGVLTIVEEPVFGGTSAAFDMDWTCSRCQNPFPVRRREIDAYVAGGRVDLDVLAGLLR